MVGEDEAAFARQRLQSCEILAHELRNTLIKLGFIFSAVNSQIGIIREAWAQHLRAEFPELEWKETILEKLNQLIRSRLPGLPASSDMLAACESLLIHQSELATLSIVPQQGELWITNRIRPRWEELLSRSALWERTEVMDLLERLDKSLRLGMDPGIISKVSGVPLLLAQKWADCAYTYITAENLKSLDDIIDLLDEAALPLPYKFQIRKVMKSLKALIETIPEVEETATKIVRSLRYGIGPEIETPADLDRMFAFRGRADEFGLAD